VKALRAARNVEQEVAVTPTFSEDEAAGLIDLIGRSIDKFTPKSQAILRRAQNELLGALTAAREGWTAQRDR
jgi:hypothetical protein